MQHEPSTGAVAQAQPGFPGVSARGDGVGPGDQRDDRDGGIDVGALEPGENFEPVGAGVLAVDLGQPPRRRVVGRDDGAVAVEQHQPRCVREPGRGHLQRRMGAEGCRHDRRDGFQDGDVGGVERCPLRLAEESADAPGLPGGAEHHPQFVVVALWLQEAAVAGAAHRPVVGGRAQRRRRGVAAGEVGEEVGVLLVELPEPERVAVAVIEVLHAGG